MGKGIIKANRGGGNYEVEIILARERAELELKLLAEKKEDLESKRYNGPWSEEREQKDKELTLAIVAIEKRISFINEHLPANPVVFASCVDFVDDLPLESEVGTIEIARSYSQVWYTGVDTPYLYTAGYWIRPAFSDQARYNPARDGILNPPINQSPTQLFYNWAMSPGTMKWKPRYRRGEIIRLTGDYADVTLTDLVYLTEDKTAVDIDQTLTLLSVPIEYMDCNGLAFEEGDIVIVEFTGMDWKAPKVIGFYSAPQECMPTEYYSVLFEKYAGFASLPSDPSQIYVRKYLKIKEDGSLEWVEDSEAAAQCNINDSFKSTKQRMYNGVMYWEEEDTYLNCPYEIWCPSEKLNPDGPSVPYNFGVFGSVYPGAFYLARPKGTSTIYDILGFELNIWSSSLAVGISTRAETKVFLKNNVRKVDTEVWTYRFDGSFYGQFKYAWWEAVEREIGGTRNYVCVEYFFRGIMGDYYQGVTKNGAFISGSDKHPESLVWSYTYGIAFPEYHTWWYDLSRNHTIEAEKTPVISTSSWKWEGPHPTGMAGLADDRVNYMIGRRDGTIPSDQFAPTSKVIFEIEADPHGSGQVYVLTDGIEAPGVTLFYCPCYSGPTVVPGSFDVQAYDQGSFQVTGATLPFCEERWTHTRFQGGYEEEYLYVPKPSKYWPSAEENYEEGVKEFEFYQTHYYPYVGLSNENIVSVFYSIDPDLPDYIYLIVNYTQTNDLASGYDNKNFKVTLSKLTGEVVSSSNGDGFEEGSINVTGNSRSIYTSQLVMQNLTNFLNAKKIELGAYNYSVCRLIKK